jgi:hypothetical protein
VMCKVSGALGQKQLFWIYHFSITSMHNFFLLARDLDIKHCMRQVASLLSQCTVVKMAIGENYSCVLTGKDHHVDHAEHIASWCIGGRAWAELAALPNRLLFSSGTIMMNNLRHHVCFIQPPYALHNDRTYLSYI